MNRYNAVTNLKFCLLIILFMTVLSGCYRTEVAVLGAHNSEVLDALPGTYEAFEHKNDKGMVKAPDHYYITPIKDTGVYRFGPGKDDLNLQVKKLTSGHYIWQLQKPGESVYIQLFVRRDENGFAVLIPTPKNQEVETLAQKHSLSLKFNKLSGNPENILAFMAEHQPFETKEALVLKKIK